MGKGNKAIARPKDAANPEGKSTNPITKVLDKLGIKDLVTKDAHANLGERGSYAAVGGTDRGLPR